MRKQKKFLFLTGLMVMLCTMFVPMHLIKANEKMITVTEEGGCEYLVTGETGTFQVPETVTYDGEVVAVDSVVFTSSNEELLSVDENGAYHALAYGFVGVSVDIYAKHTQSQEINYNKYGSKQYYYGNHDGWGFDENENGYNDGWGADENEDGYNDGWGADENIDDSTEYEPEGKYLVFQAYYEFVIQPDLSKVSIKQTSQTKYMDGNSWQMPEFTFELNSKEVLNDTDDEIISVSCQSSNNDIYVSAYLENNRITLIPSQAGKTTVIITINEKEFKVNIQTVLVNISKNSLLMSKSQVKQLKVPGIKQKVKWSSSNSKVATVSSTGKVKAKKNGNVVIKAEIGDIKVGCAVSVVSPNRQKAIKRAIQIGKTCKYSQEKRMQNNYYDCSSLVWKSYSKYGINFGSVNYAPVDADQGKWCASHKKLVKGGLSLKNVNSMKLNAGNLMFETSENKERYRGIYHVEMIAGYVCYGFDSKGKPILGITWANRSENYYGYGGQMVGRP